MIDASAFPSMGVLMAAGAAIVFAAIFALLRGFGGDPLERLARWAGATGLDYVAPENPEVLATFVGEVRGRGVEVVVTRVARSFGSDVPPRITTVTAGRPGGDTACVLQPAGWVMDRDGRAAGEPTPTGDASFDARWSARGDAGAVALLVTSALRARLLAADADGLVIEVSARAVAIPMPGVCTDPRELDRRLTLALALARAIDPAPMA